MNKNRFKSLKTERLNLRRLYLKDTKQYFKVIGSSDKVSKYTLWEPHKNIDETEMLMREWVSQYNDNNFYFPRYTVQVLSALFEITLPHSFYLEL